MAPPKSDSSKHATDKPCSHRNVSVLVLFVFLVSACVAFAVLLNTMNQRLAAVERELEYHKVQLNALNKHEPNDEKSTIQDKSGGPDADGATRNRRSLDNKLTNVTIVTVRSLISKFLVNMTASRFCQPPNKVCVPGSRGPRGKRGRKGVKGVKGTTGKFGKQGARGPSGPRGSKGAPGPRGPRGLPGPKGSPGEQVSAPAVLVSPATLTVTRNQAAKFTCTVSGNPKPAVTWAKVSGKLNQRTTVHQSGLLEIKASDASDAGAYVCSAKSIMGEAKQTVRLQVKVPPRLTKTPALFQDVTQGNTLIATCVASGFPAPVTTWSKLGGVFPPQRSRQYSNGTLVIREFILSDSGTYVCKVANAIGHKKTYMTLNFLKKKLVYRAKFTNLGATGQSGPTSIGDQYDGQGHAGQVTLSSGIQLWRVPKTGSYRIEAVGASGGYEVRTKTRRFRGRGARMIGTFDLNKGDVIKILIGQEGGVNPRAVSSAGGGGTFVVANDNSPLIIAGGGAGIERATKRYDSANANSFTHGNPGYGGKHWAGGRDGQGATQADAGFSGGGGGGLLSSGQSGKGGKGGKGFLQGGVGGQSIRFAGPGGFGGGGGTYGSGGGAGGGGGYSGGAAGDNNSGSSGGGGGSFNNGASSSNSCCYNDEGHGYVNIVGRPSDD